LAIASYVFFYMVAAVRGLMLGAAMAESAKPSRLSAAECRKHAEQCRKLAKQVNTPEHRAMLLDMAETWDRLAGGVSNGH
jgi:hypothetical protein